MDATRPEIWRYPQVKKATGLSRTTIWRQCRKGRFPQAVKISSQLVGCRSSEVMAWLDALPRAGRTPMN
mgnify:CR=1 FL=1